MSNNKQIKCPKCGTVFQIDENDYNELLSQIEESKISERVNLLKDKLENQHKLEVAELKAKYSNLENEKKS